MAYAMLNAGKRKTKKINYLELHTVGKPDSEMENVQEDLLELQAEEDGEFEEGQLSEEEDPAAWKQRRLAVNDENYKREQESYQRQMQLLNEKELLIEREKKLLEMKEHLASRQKHIRELEKDLATRAAVLDRYDENIMQIEREKDLWRTQKSLDVNSWVENTVQLGQTKNVKFAGENAVNRNASLTRNNGYDYNAETMYNNAMALTHDENLDICRQTGTSRLKNMGIAPEQMTSKKGRRSEPVRDDMIGGARPKVLQKTSSTSLLPGPGAMAVRQPVVGKLDDGESVISVDSKMSIEGNNSDKSLIDKKKIKSGMYAKVADDVVKQLKWPHKKLATRWVPGRLLMNQLTFEHVVAGELAIIQRATDPEEVRSRIHILQKVAYWNMQNEGWPRVREVYMSILHSIEEGESNFKSSFDEFDSLFPVKRNVLQPKKTGKKEVYWCRAYNKGQCTEESGHKTLISGMERVVQHICAACWKIGKREKHMETDPACPQKEL